MEREIFDVYSKQLWRETGALGDLCVDIPTGRELVFDLDGKFSV